MGTFDHTWSISVFCRWLVLVKRKRRLYLHMYFSNYFVLALFCSMSILKSPTMTMVSFRCKCSNALERTFSMLENVAWGEAYRFNIAIYVPWKNIFSTPSQHSFLRNVYGPKLVHVFSPISSPHV